MVSKVMGIDQVIDSIVMRLGELERAYLIDDYAEKARIQASSIFCWSEKLTSIT